MNISSRFFGDIFGKKLSAKLSKGKKTAGIKNLPPTINF
jgi:hypothetical protein